MSPANNREPGFQVSKEISWGDISMAVAGAVSIIVVTVQLQSRVDQVAKDLNRVEIQVNQNMVDLRSLETSEAARRQELRSEIRQDLVEINRKLDRLVERGSPAK